MSLTNKQRAFVEEYLKDFNATQAAIRAGYSEKTARSIGSENLAKPDISAEIDIRVNEIALSAHEVLLRLTEQARGEHSRYLTAEGVDLHELINDGKGHLVKRIKETRYGLDIEFYDAQSALVHIGRYHKLFTDNIDHTSGGEKLVPVQYIEIVRPDDDDSG